MWRVLWPVTELQSQGYPVFWEWSDNPKVPDIVSAFDMIVYPRQAWLDEDVAREFVSTAHKYGKLIVGEYDDDVWYFREDQKDSEELGFEKTEATPEQNRSSLQVMDGATLSTHRLEMTVKQFAPEFPTRVIGNYINLDWWEMTSRDWPRQLPEEELTIGWAGGDRYDRDIESLAEAWHIIAEKYTDVSFVIQGYQPKILSGAVPEDRLYNIEFLPIASDDKPSYPVGLKNIDIGCASVAETMFNASKTRIKLWEYAASGAACIGSSWLYGPGIVHGTDGLIANTVDEWVSALSFMIEKPKKRKAMARKMLSKVRTHNTIQDNAWRWVKAWQEIYDVNKWKLTNRVMIPGVDG